MPVRTCDLGEIVRRVEDAAVGTRPVFVAVSGFSASGTTSLASRLQERIDGSVVVGVDLLERTAPLVMTDRWAAGERAELRRRLADQAEVVVVEGSGLLHPGVSELFHLRVWLDVDLEGAAGRGALRAYEEPRRHGGPLGRWVADEPPERVVVDSVEAEFFGRFRPDRAADVLFVPVGRMSSPIRVRFMTEVGCAFVLWDDDNEYIGELENLLPMPGGLRQRILRHADDWYRYDGGERLADWPGVEEFDRHGYLLSLELQEALGTHYRVDYSFDTAAD